MQSEEIQVDIKNPEWISLKDEITSTLSPNKLLTSQKSEDKLSSPEFN